MDERKDILLAKWLSGELTEAEIKDLGNEYDIKALKEILDAQKDFEPVTAEPEIIWDNILRQKEPHVDEKSREDMQNKKIKRNQIIGVFLVLGLLLISLLYFFSRNSKTFIQTKNEISTEQFFADGSNAIIGPNSELQFNSSEWENKREIQLLGQAYFTVTKGTPFSVITSAGTIQVLGTQFDVWNIHPNYMRVSCTEGKVQVKDNQGTTKVLTAGQYVYVVNDKIKDVETISNPILDWQENFRNYETTPMSIVLSDLERFYSVRFEIEDSIASDLFSGVLPINDLSKCIQYIETSLSYESKRETHKIIFLETH